MSYPADMFRWPPAELRAAAMMAHVRPTQAVRCYQTGQPVARYLPPVIKVGLFPSAVGPTA